MAGLGLGALRRRAGPVAAAGRRRSVARQLLVALCYLAVTRFPSDVFVGPAGCKASRPEPLAARRGTATVEAEAEADEAKLNVKAVQGEGPFGTKYRRAKQNAPILLGLALFAGLLIFRQDIITILALYEYSGTSEENWIAASAMVVARLPTDLVTGYGESALASPIFVKAMTSCVAYFVGDILAQGFEGRVRFEWLDLPRCTRNAAAGFFLHGPALHFWILFLEGPFSSFIGASAANDTEPWVIASKIFIDQTAFALFLSVFYALFVGFLSSKPLDQVLLRTKETVPPSMVSSWRFWPLVHIITYSPFMPIEFKVLWNDVAEIAWVAILSVIANDDREENPEGQLMVVTEDFGVEPAAEIALVSAREKSG